MIITDALVEKYNKSGPRYTSYPPVPFWNNPPSQNSWPIHLKKNYQTENGLDLYIHIPFCESLCSFCACNKFITKNHDKEDPYIQALLKEWSIYLEKLGPIKLSSVHLGGGTPTFFAPEKLDQLLGALSPYFHQTQFIGAIEIDPRTCKIGHLQVLKKHKFNRISLGIQDFDFKVQKAVNRVQSYDLVKELINNIKSHEFDGLNFDLIYGLPYQTIETITDTFEKVLEFAPDTIAYYGYAHVPWKVKSQNLIDEKSLPSEELKKEIFDRGKLILEKNNYIPVGFDHFARPGSFLDLAMKSGTLQRNFMGYTDKKSNMILGLGVSSISTSSDSFIQNEKTVKSYYERLEKNELPICSGHTHTKKDLDIDFIIQDLMCKGIADITPVKSWPEWDIIQSELEEMKSDGLIKDTDKIDHLQITQNGRSYLRNICMVFDFHLKNKTSTGPLFSKTV